MRIALITTSRIPSTTANSIQVMKVVQSYAQLGQQVTLIFPSNKKINLESISDSYGLESSFKLVSFPSLRIFRRYDFFIFTWLFLNFNKFDLVHTWLPQVARQAGRKDIPYILEIHGLPTGKFGPGMMEKVLFSNHKRLFLIITNALKRLYEDQFQYRFNEREVLIAPNGVEFQKYPGIEEKNKIRKKLNLENQFSAIYTGHLYPGRGMELMVDLAKATPEIKYIWVGGNKKDIDFWGDLIKREKISNIALTGFVDHRLIPEYQVAADVLLMPYQTDIAGSGGGNSVEFCSPMKMFEYMAAGKPIIASDLPILHEVLNTGNAFFCQHDNLDQWVETIRLIANEPAAAQVKANEARIAVKEFTWEKRALKSLEKLGL